MSSSSICQLSGESFLVHDDEISFLEKICPRFHGESFPIPLPKISPDERARQRAMHRNEDFLYKNTSIFTEKPLVSLYRPESLAKVVTSQEWFGDGWDPCAYAIAFDASHTFFDQFSRIQKEIPRATTVTLGNENCEYTTGTGYCKNCYLINCSEYCEDCYYSKLLQSSKNCIDCSYVYESELMYECFNCEKCFGGKYLIDCVNCSDCWMCASCFGCSDCFGCVNLHNKQYHFMNQDCGSKEAYLRKLEELHLHDGDSIDTIREKFLGFYQSQPHKYVHINNCEDCTGDFITNSRNCHDCYDVSKSDQCRYLQVGVQCTSVFDASNMYIKPELCYQTLGTIEVYNCHFCLYVFHSHDLWYCEQCFHCEYCFGCVGLRNKKYHIFNKAYTPDEYQKHVAQIIPHMMRTGEWGVYFPNWISPFAYNESVASDYYPLTAKEASDRGYVWYDGNQRSHTGVFYEPLPIDQYDEARVGTDQARANIQSCLQGVVRCRASQRPFKIIPQELIFYIRNHLPIPRLCPEERHKVRMQLRNPRTLYQRTCAHTGEELWSTYSPDQPIVILGEKAFQENLK